MLQRLRDKAQGWVAWVIVGAIAFTFVLVGTDGFRFNDPNKRVVAKAAGEKIYAHQLEALYQRFMRQPGNDALKTIEPDLIKNELLQSLIEQTIVTKDMVKMGMNISPNLIVSELTRVPAFLNAQGQFSEDQYARYLTSAGYTDQSFRNMIRESLLSRQLQLGLTETTFILTSELNDLANYTLQKRDFAYKLINKNKFISKINISDAHINHYYKNHLDDYKTQERLSLEYILLTKADIEKSAQIDEASLKQFYEDNKTQFAQPEKRKLAHILILAPQDKHEQSTQDVHSRMQAIQEKLDAGESFSDLAKTYSDDQSSRDNGGELEWVAKGEIIPEFEAVAFALKDKNQVSEPIKSDFGYHFIQLIDVKPAKQFQYDEITDKVKELYLSQWAEEKFVQTADELAALAYDSPDSLQDVADSLQLPLLQTALFNQSGEGLEVEALRHPELLSAAYSPIVKEEKNNSDLIKLSDDSYAVIRIKEHVLPEQKSLDQVKEEIRALLQNEQLDDMMLAAANRLMKQVKTADTAQRQQIMLQDNWKQEKAIARSNQIIDPNVINAAFSLPRALSENESSIREVKLEDGNYAVVYLNSIEQGSIDELTQQEKEVYQQEMKKRMSQLEFLLYVEKLLDDAKVEIKT